MADISTFIPVWVWNPVALPGAVALLMGMAFASFVYFVRPDGTQNRRLAIVIFFESLTWGTGAGLLFATDELGAAVGFQALFQIGLLVLPWVYLRFLATLDSPLSRWLRNRVVDRLLLVGSLTSPLFYFQDRSRFVTGFDPVWYAPWEAHLGPWFLPMMSVIGIVTLYALVVAFDVFRRSGTSATRARARAYLYAFGIRDGILLGITLVLPFFVPLPPADSWTDLLYVFGAPASTLLWVPVAAYGILRSQLFDIDLKIRITIERSTLIALFAGLTFVLSELFETLFLGALTGGHLVLALLAAGAVAFLLRRVPQRLAAFLMPHADDADHLALRRIEVYRIACEGALQDGAVDAREVEVLRRLREHLGIRPEEAERIASSVGAPAPAAATSLS